MTDSKRIRGPADRRRVALTEDYERLYLADKLEACAIKLHEQADYLESQVMRIRSGFPKRAARNRGKR